jgi:hypothetical protein
LSDVCFFFLPAWVYWAATLVAGSSLNSAQQ